MEGISSSLLTDQLIAGHSCQAGWSNHCGTIKRGGVPTKSATSVPAKQDEIQNIETLWLIIEHVCSVLFLLYTHTKNIFILPAQVLLNQCICKLHIFECVCVSQETFGCRALQALWVKRSALKPMWVTTTRRGLLGRHFIH